MFWQGHEVALKGGGGFASRVFLAFRQEGFQWVAGRVLSEGNDNNEERKKKVESDGSEETIRFIRFANRTTGLTGPIPV